MPLRNTRERFGWVSVSLHWLVAVAIIGLFALGLYMVDLTYYDPWYTAAPDWHRSVGIVLMLVVGLRLLWRWVSPPPPPLPEHSRTEQVSAKVVHGLLYLLIVLTGAAGYLISTADGSSIDVFGWFSVPSVTGEIKRMEDWAGEVHFWLAWSIIFLAGLHALGALKHHFVDRDATLRRMLGLLPRR